jgi:hypothetical protein
MCHKHLSISFLGQGNKREGMGFEHVSGFFHGQSTSKANAKKAMSQRERKAKAQTDLDGRGDRGETKGRKKTS